MKTNEKKILITASTFPRWKGDSEPPFILDMAQALTKYFRVYVLVPHAYGAKKKEIWNNVHVNRFSYIIPHKWQKLCYGGGIHANLLKSKINYLLIPFFIIGEIIAVVHLIKREKIDLLYANWVIPQGFVAALIKKAIRIPIIINILGADIGLNNLIMKKMVKYSLRRADHVVGLTDAIKKEIEKLNIENINISVIPLGIYSDLFDPSMYSYKIRERYNAGSTPLLLFVGRLVEKKGVVYLIKALPDILKGFNEAKLLIIGNGLLKEDLKQLSAKLGLSKNINFEDGIDNKMLPQYYASADIFIGPSIIPESGDLEGQGVVFLEAIASGCCTIGTNIGGIPMAIINEKTGLLVEQKNSQQISEAVIRILEDTRLKECLKTRGRKYVVDNFDWTVVGKTYKKFFERFM